MLTHNEQKRLDELKLNFSNSLNIVDYSLNGNELNIIFQEIKKYPITERNKQLWKKVVTEKIGNICLGIRKSLDVSDINYIHVQIQELLTKENDNNRI